MAAVPALLEATHLGPSLAVTGMATGLGAVSGVAGARLALLGAAVLAGQFSVGWANDLVDRHRDRAAGRTDKPIVRGAVGAGSVRVAAFAALAATVPLSLAVDPVGGAAHLAAVALGWAYDLGIKATPASPLPYAGAFGLLPVFVAAAAGGTAPAWVVGGAALLGAGSHFTNTLPDVVHDATTGVRGLPQRLGTRASAVVGALLLGAGAGVTAWGLSAVGELGAVGRLALGAAGLLVAAVLVVGLRAGTRLAFTLSMAAGVAVVVLLAGAGPLLGSG